MAEVDRVVWKNCVNQQAQAIISRVATLTELESVDSFTENEEFIQWCHENYTHQAGISRIWAVTHLQESELFPSYFEQSLVSVSHYVRNSDVKTFTILDYGKSRGLNKVLYLSGCPQIGKSTTVFAWLLAQVAEDKTTRFLWIHCTEGIYYFIDSNGPEGQLRCSGSVLHANLEQVLMKARSNYQIICFDGNFGQNIKTLVSIAHRLGRFVIVCSPERMVKVKFAFEDLHPMMTLLVDSWTLEDYQQMNQNNLFNYLNNGHRLSNEELRLRHYYGGGCLYQFKAGKALAVRNYRRRLEEFGTNQLSFLEAGTSSTESKSSLLAVYNGNSVIVSDFVREEISKAANHDVMKSLRAVYSSNPRFQAFRSQYEVEFILRMCVNANRGIRFWGFRYFTMYGGRQSATHSLKVLNYVNYDNLLDLSAITNGILKSGTIYLLNGSLHETFHFVFYEVASGIHQFYFVNVSDVATRDFNYQLCGAFISTFFPEFPLQQQRAFPTMGIIRPTNYHVHVSYLTSKENFERARVGREENIEDIRNYDNLFPGARIKYFEGSAF